jgi:hypothetical protein
VQPVQESVKNELENFVLKLVTSQQEYLTEQRQFVNSQHQTNARTEQSIQRLEAQIGQIARELSERKNGEFPAQTILNPRGH